MALIARWTFAGLGGPWDETENWQKVELRDNARLTHRGLELPQGGVGAGAACARRDA